MRTLAAACAIAAVVVPADPAGAVEVARVPGEPVAAALGPEGHLAVLVRPSRGQGFATATAPPGALPQTATPVPASRFRTAGDIDFVWTPALSVDRRGGLVAVWPSSDRTSRTYQGYGDYLDYCCDQVVAAVRAPSGRWRRPRAISPRGRPTSQARAVARSDGSKAVLWIADGARGEGPRAQLARAGRRGRFGRPRDLLPGPLGTSVEEIESFGLLPDGALSLAWTDLDRRRFTATAPFRASRELSPPQPPPAPAESPVWVDTAPDGTAIAGWTQRRASGRGAEVRYAVRDAAGRYGAARVLLRGGSDSAVTGPVVAVASGGRGVIVAATRRALFAVRVPGGRPRRIARWHAGNSLPVAAVAAGGHGAVSWGRGRSALVARVQ